MHDIDIVARIESYYIEIGREVCALPTVWILPQIIRKLSDKPCKCLTVRNISIIAREIGRIFHHPYFLNLKGPHSAY